MNNTYQYRIGYITDGGNVRTNNQDSFLIRSDFTHLPDTALLAVADGMGGLANGEEASARTVNELERWFDEQLSDFMVGGPDWSAIKNSLFVTVDRINFSIFSTSNAEGIRCGTTLTLALVYQSRYLIQQIGDSRAYLLHNQKLKQLTKDQTWCRAEIDAGRLTEAQARTHPMRHVLTSGLGVAENYTIETLEGTLLPGDGLLLCSDGFYNEMDDTWYRQKGSDPQTLLDKAALTIRSGVAEDNFTAVLACMPRARRWLW